MKTSSHYSSAPDEITGAALRKSLSAFALIALLSISIILEAGTGGAEMQKQVWAHYNAETSLASKGGEETLQWEMEEAIRGGIDGFEFKDDIENDEGHAAFKHRELFWQLVHVAEKMRGPFAIALEINGAAARHDKNDLLGALQELLAPVKESPNLARIDGRILLWVSDADKEASPQWWGELFKGLEERGFPTFRLASLAGDPVNAQLSASPNREYLYRWLEVFDGFWDFATYEHGSYEYGAALTKPGACIS